MADFVFELSVIAGTIPLAVCLPQRVEVLQTLTPARLVKLSTLDFFSAPV
jgi:hypothetical protein